MINKEAYIKLIEQDIEYLRLQDNTVEQCHIIEVLKHSIQLMYLELNNNNSSFGRPFDEPLVETKESPSNIAIDQDETNNINRPTASIGEKSTCPYCDIILDTNNCILRCLGCKNEFFTDGTN